MPASFPLSIRLFSAKQDSIDVNYAAHINDLQDEVTAIETVLGPSPAGAAATVKDRIAGLETGKAESGHSHDYLSRTLVNAKGDLLVGTAANTVARQAIGPNGRVLTADSSAASGMAWAALPAAPGETLPLSTFDAKGDILVGTGDNQVGRTTAPTAPGRALVADPDSPTGVGWSPTAAITATSVGGKGRILVGLSTTATAGLPVGLVERALLVVDPSSPYGIAWGFNPRLAGYSESLNTSSGLSFDVQTANVFSRTLTSSGAATFVAPPSGQVWSFTLILTQDSVGGRNVTWPAGVRWPHATVPTPDTTPNRTNIYTFMTTTGGASWFGALTGKGMG